MLSRMTVIRKFRRLLVPVNCFIERETFQGAEEIALKFLKEENWLLIALEEGYEVNEYDYEGDPEGLEVYK
jgi:hypothetical protein